MIETNFNQTIGSAFVSFKKDINYYFNESSLLDDKDFLTIAEDYIYYYSTQDTKKILTRVNIKNKETEKEIELNNSIESAFMCYDNVVIYRTTDKYIKLISDTEFNKLEELELSNLLSCQIYRYNKNKVLIKQDNKFYEYYFKEITTLLKLSDEHKVGEINSSCLNLFSICITNGNYIIGNDKDNLTYLYYCDLKSKPSPSALSDFTPIGSNYKADSLVLINNDCIQYDTNETESIMIIYNMKTQTNKQFIDYKGYETLNTTLYIGFIDETNKKVIYSVIPYNPADPGQIIQDKYYKLIDELIKLNNSLSANHRGETLTLAQIMEKILYQLEIHPYFEITP